MSASSRPRLVLIFVVAAWVCSTPAAARPQDGASLASTEISTVDRERLAALEAEAIALAESGAYAEADARIVALIEIERHVYGDASALLANSYSYRAGLAESAADRTAAVSLRRQEVAIRERAGDSLALAMARTDLANDLVALDRNDEADLLYRSAFTALPTGGERFRPALGLANSLMARGRNDEAEAFLAPVVEEAEALAPAEAELVPDMRYALAVARYNAGRPEAAEAPARAACGEPTAVLVRISAAACFLMTLILDDTDRAAEAEPLLVRLIEAEPALLRPSDRAATAQALATIRQDQDRIDEVEPLLRMAVAFRLTESDAPTSHQGFAASALAVWLDGQDRAADAEPFNRQALDLYRRAAASDLDVAIAVANLSTTLIKLGRSDEAASLVRQAMADPPANATAAYESKLVPALLAAVDDREPAEAAALRLRMIAEAEASGADAETLASLYSKLANDYGMAFDWARAVDARARALAHFRAAANPLNAALELAYYGRALGQVEDSAASYAALSQAKAELLQLSPSEEQRLYVDLHLAAAAEGVGRPDEALSLIAPVVAARRKPGEDPKALVLSLQIQADILTQLDRLTEAEAVLTEARGLAVPGDLAGDYTISIIDTALALIWQDQGRFDEAERLLRDAIDTAGRLFGPGSMEVRTPLNNLAMMLNRTGRRERALVLLQQAAAIEAEALPPDAPARLDSQVKIARQLSDLGQTVEAEALLADLVPRTAARLGEAAETSREARRQYGFLLVRRHDYVRGIPELERVVALERAGGISDDQAVGTIHLLAYATYANGDYGRTIELMQEAVLRASPIGATRLSIDLRSNLGKVLVADGRPREALVPLRDAAARSIQAAAAAQAGLGVGAEIARDPFRVLVEAAWMTSR